MWIKTIICCGSDDICLSVDGVNLRLTLLFLCCALPFRYEK